MKMSELSRQTGVAVPTIKYYLREGLLAPGEPIKVNQAQYNNTHLHRLRIIRALSRPGGMPIDVIRRLLTRLTEHATVPDALGHALADTTIGINPNLNYDATRDTDKAIARLGWDIESDSGARYATIFGISQLRNLGVDVPIDYLERYGELAAVLAEVDANLISSDTDPDDDAELLYRAIMIMVVGDNLLAALRRLALENLLRTRSNA